MSLKIAAPPKNGLRMLEKGLASLAPSAAGDPLAKAMASKGIINASAPHPIYDVPAADVASGRGFRRARIVGWRYLLMSGASTVGAAELVGGGRRTRGPSPG